MSGVASKNLYELLGNDPDQDPDLRVEPPPVLPVDKPTQRTGKRNAGPEAPVAAAAAAPATNGERGGRGRGRARGAGRGRGRGNEGAFLDGEAGRNRNRDRPVDEEGGRGGRARGNYEGRAGRGRGGRGGRVRDDRHSHTVHSGPDAQAKQAAHGWGGETGAAELQDEQAGEAIAAEEEKTGGDNYTGDEPVNADGEKLTSGGAAAAAEEEAEEDKTKSYADYLAEQAQKKLQLGDSLNVRKANEGSKSSQPEGKTVAREETDYFIGGAGKARRERERKDKNVFVIEHDIGAREQTSTRGGRGGRGGRGDGGARGEGRGGRGGGFRGRGEGRGEFRGGRGGRGGGPTPNVSSAQDFPGLGQ